MKKSIVNKRIVITLLLVIVLSVFTGCSKQPGEVSTNGGEITNIRLNMACIVPPATNTAGREIEDWYIVEINKRLEERTNYQIDWNMMYGATIVKPGEEINSVQNAIVDMSTVVYPYEASKLPLQNVFYWLPFISPDPEVATNVANRLSEEIPEFNSIFEERYNQKLLVPGFAQLSFNLFTKFPVEDMNDLGGHKIGAGGANLETVSAGGAVPVQSSGSESYSSIQTGVYDGWVNDISSVVKSKLYEVAPYFTKVQFGSVANAGITINLDTYNKLPKEVIAVIEEVSDEFGIHLAKILKDEESIMEDEWVKNGGTINEFSEEDRIIWANKLSGYPAQKAKEFDAKDFPATETIKLFYELMQEYGHEFIYEIDLD